jgi:hypothetical protein
MSINQGGNAPPFRRLNMTNEQLQAAINNGKRDALHLHRMATNRAYQERKQSEEREYEEFCRIYGEPEY